MSEDQEQNEKATIETLEHADTKESYRQLWWTIGVTAICFGIIVYVYS
ncbi:MAG: hypothetical protein P8L31_03775 [Pseudomonadales bacterium]|nr:hypothetical protein [Pseudomonadales bacterium]